MSKKIYIHISQAFLPGGGGLEQTLDRLVIGLNKRNTEILCLSSKNYTEEIKFDNHYKYTVVRANSKFYKLVRNLNYKFNTIVGGNKQLGLIGKASMAIFAITSCLALLWLLIKRLRLHRNETVFIHAHSLNSLFVSVATKIMFKQTKVCIIFINHFTFVASGFKLFDYLITKALKSANYTVSLSNYSRQQLMNHFEVDSRTSFVCLNWLDYSVMPSQARTTKQRKSLNLLYVGRIVPEKGISKIIEIAEYAASNDINMVLTVVGDSDHSIKARLSKTSSTLKTLNYVGRVEQPELWKYYAANDIFIFPTEYREGLPTTVLEAVYFGLPIITTKLEPMPEIVSYFDRSLYKCLKFTSTEQVFNTIMNINYRKDVLGRIHIADCNLEILHKYFSSRNLQVFKDIYSQSFSYYET